MLEPTPSPYRVAFDGSFRVESAPTAPAPAPERAECEKKLAKVVKKLRKLQRKLYAYDRFSLLLIFQAMDAAGKDGTIRAVMSGINPAGCQVFSFKRPSTEEYDHDFLWRTAVRLPERGRIGIFNRSYYESVLVVRVHPRFLEGEQLPPGATTDLGCLWEDRYASIRDHERHLARNGTVVLKFWLNVSRAEQKRRFLKRIDDPDRNWKFSAQDLAERARWPEYMTAYEDALNATSRPWAPWYALPADNKPFMRLEVARIVAKTLERMPLRYPLLDEAARAQLESCRQRLLTESSQ